MNNSSQTKHACKSCRYYQAYYANYGFNLMNVGVGLCIKKQCIVQKNNFCRSYKYRLQKAKIVTLEFINTVIVDIEEIKSILSVL